MELLPAQGVKLPVLPLHSLLVVGQGARALRERLPRAWGGPSAESLGFATPRATWPARMPLSLVIVYGAGDGHPRRGAGWGLGCMAQLVGASLAASQWIRPLPTSVPMYVHHAEMSHCSRRLSHIQPEMGNAGVVSSQISCCQPTSASMRVIELAQTRGRICVRACGSEKACVTW